MRRLLCCSCLLFSVGFPAALYAGQILGFVREQGRRLASSFYAG